MIISDDLHKLIKSLEKHEKIYFKRFSGLHVMGNANNYIRLFDVIDEMKEYDESALMIKFAEEKFTRQLSVAKNYLYQAILKSLKTMRPSKSKKEEIQNLLTETNILFEKRLYSQCGKLLRRAKKTAERYEKHPELLEILNWEMQLIHTEDILKKFEEKNIKRIFDERKELFRIRENLNEYDRLERNLKTLTGFVKDRDAVEYKKKLKEFIKHPLLKSDSAALSTVGKLKYNAILANYYYELQEHEKSFDYEIKQIELLDENEGIKKERFIDYLILLSNTLLLCVNLKKYTEFNLYLEKLKAQENERIVQRSSSFQLYILERTYLMEMFYSNETKNYVRIPELYDNVLKITNERGMQLREADRIHMEYFVSAAYFGSGDFEKSLEVLNGILGNKEAESRQVEYLSARMFNLILQYELGNLDLLEYSIESTQKYLKERKKRSVFEKLYFKMMVRLVKKKPGHKEKDIFGEFKYEMDKLDPKEYKVGIFDRIDIIEWLESKL